MFDRSTQEGVAFLHVIRFCQKKKIANVCSVLCNNSKQTNEDRNKFNACCFYFVFFHCGFCHISSVDATAKQLIYIYFLFCFSCVWCWNASAFHEDHHTHTHTPHQILRKTCERCLSPSSFLPQSHYFCRGFSIGGNPILFCYSSNVYFIMHSLCKRVVCVLSSSSQKRHLSQHIQRGLQFVFC